MALEAMRPLHDPAFHAIEDALGEIAPIRRASLRFGKYSSRYNEILAGRATNIFDCNMASGSLMDIGVYTVEPMVEIFGMPSGLTSMTTLLDPTTRQLTHGPIVAAVPSSPATAVAVSPSSSRTPKLRTTCCPRRSKASVALSRSTI